MPFQSDRDKYFLFWVDFSNSSDLGWPQPYDYGNAVIQSPTSDLYPVRDVVEILKISRRQLQYWAQTDLIGPSAKTPGGHGRYTFHDLVALKAAKRLIDALAKGECRILRRLRLMPTGRIIVECLHGHWSAWFEELPQIAFGGATPAEAVDRLAGFVLPVIDW